MCSLSSAFPNQQITDVGIPGIVFLNLSWARDAERAKARMMAETAEAVLENFRNEAEHERRAWESLRVTLEDAAATREREAREAAEESAREVGR